ncbi:enoyl-CoA hydratase/isomerase family protein [Deferribacter autotrophicus]|uniref:Enoyl-CoA hydratase/isomerase family protein n=1 Tax=Deferribacter autotrophicus TaxID=500465 RepID=A0A5A8F166_9BACT|nr:enoyl-CoA hydratase/isomerase family protein [Deferribacter autotrophicus]KAA0257808.1 enoyl-CoA hydratase/isomerase family protein [Deferribacter autotrophicus]
MERFKIEKKETVAYIIMDNGENKQDLEFASQFLQALEEVEKDVNVKALIITSSDEKNWSQGVHVEWIQKEFFSKNYNSVKQFLYTMNDVFKKIIFYPIPTIAEITGHAFGNGALLSCCCDFRFMRNDRGFFCFPEVDVKIPFLPSMIAFAKKAIPYQKFQEIVFTGNRYTAKELEEMGVIHKATDNLEQLKGLTFEFAKSFNKARGIYAELKRRMFVDIEMAFEKDKEVIEPLHIFVP